MYTERHPARTRPRRSGSFAFLVSLIIHGALALILGGLWVTRAVIEENVVMTEFFEVKQAKPKRRIPPRAVNLTSPPTSTPTAATRLSRPGVTMANLPVVVGETVLPAGDSLIAEEAIRSIPRRDVRLDIRTRRPLRDTRQVAVSNPSALLSPIQPGRTLEIRAVEPEVSPEPFPSEVAEIRRDLSDVTRAPRFLRKVVPRYPDAARRNGVKGTVWLEATIDVEGRAQDIRVVKGLGAAFERAAIEALRASRFTPARRGETPVNVRVQIPYRFELS